MQAAFEKIIEKLESLEKVFIKGNSHNVAAGISRAIEIVKQEAEKFGRDTNVGSNGWIPCSGCSDCEHKECENYGKV